MRVWNADGCLQPDVGTDSGVFFFFLFFLSGLCNAVRVVTVEQTIASDWFLKQLDTVGRGTALGLGFTVGRSTAAVHSNRGFSGWGRDAGRHDPFAWAVHAVLLGKIRQYDCCVC